MANIDAELAFLRDANESSGLISREAIANALEIINAERAYPPKMLETTSNGEYNAGAGKAYTKVKVDVPGGGIKFDGFIAPFTIKENGKVYAKDYSDKDLWINEFEVDVPTYMDEEIDPVTFQSNGEYEPEENHKYGVVTVDIPDAKQPGDLVTASMYFFDPNNPNDATYIFIDKDETILFGESAREFLNRFPKFKEIDGYVHDDWNPNPDSIVSDQWYIPRWIPKPFNYSSEQKPIDYDVFLYIVRHMVLNCFFNLEDNISVNVDGQTVTLSVYCEPFKDANGQQVHYGFKMSAYDNEASTYQFELDIQNSNWIFKHWNMSIEGAGIWTDGTDIYWSYYASQYVLDKTNLTWSVKTWTGLTSFNGDYIWTDGTDIYYSNGSNQYVLDKATSTWSVKTWSGLTSFYGSKIWTDGTDTYYSSVEEQYVLDETKTIWIPFTWNNKPYYLRGEDIWSDGTNIYFSISYDTYVLDVVNHSWSQKTWQWDSSFDFNQRRLYGEYIWKYNGHIYYSQAEDQYELDMQTETWHKKSWHGIDNMYASDIWICDNHVYYSDTDHSFKKPKFCNIDTSDITSETPVSHGNYYWWGCSLARALVNGDRTMLVRQSDIDIYDNANWDIDHFVPASIKSDALDVAYYITHPKRVDTANTCRYKSVPRKNLSIVQGPNTHAPVVNPTGNPQEQGWYLYDSTNKTFNLTTDTTVDPDKTYYYVRSSYTVSVDAPVISDQFIWDDETVAYKRIGTGKQSTGWGDYDLNLRHSPILYITQENGQYKAYKKVNGNLIEYTIDDHLKYVRSHAWTSVDGYLAYRTMLGVRDKIYDTEHLEAYEDIRMEDVYFMGAAGNVRSCIYLYDKVNKIYYSFDAKKTDDEESYNATIRHSIDTEPSYISNVDAHIADRTYRPMFETHSYANDGKHGYLTEYDIWPDERVWIYATGGFFEKEQNYFPDPETGDVYSVDFAYNLIDCEDYTNYYFFNYYDVINGFNTCPPAYHFVYSNGTYVLTRVDTQYTGYTSETVEYQVEYACEKVTDKFVVDDIRGDNYINRNVYAPPYYADQARVNYEMNNFNNIINTPLIESLEIIRTVESGNRNDKGIINDINGVYSPLCTYFSNLRNTAQNLYADEETIRLFDKRDADNASNPGLYPLYDYTQASGIWQYCHDSFSRDYSLIGPHNSYTANGNPETYDYLYFFL